MQKLLAKDYVLLSLDSGKHKGADPVIEKLRKGHAGGGIPWMTIVDADGKEIVTSDAPNSGNIGCPVQPEEVAWFKTMLAKGKRRLSDADLAAIEKANETFAERYRRK